jgi:hypothetical protein
MYVSAKIMSAIMSSGEISSIMAKKLKEKVFLYGEYGNRLVAVAASVVLQRKLRL